MTEKKQEIVELRSLLEAPKTIAEIAYHMNWAYSTASQKMNTFEAGGVASRVVKNNRVLFFIPQDVEVAQSD